MVRFRVTVITQINKFVGYFAVSCVPNANPCIKFGVLKLKTMYLKSNMCLKDTDKLANNEEPNQTSQV